LLKHLLLFARPKPKYNRIFGPGIFEKEYELLYEKNEPTYSHTKPFHWFYNFKIYPALFVIV